MARISYNPEKPSSHKWSKNEEQLKLAETSELSGMVGIRFFSSA